MSKAATLEANITTVESRIRGAALEAVQFAPGDFDAAAGAMLEALGMTAELEFLAGETLRKKAQPYLAKARGGGQPSGDAHHTPAPATPLAGADDKDQSNCDIQRRPVPSAPVPRPRPRQVKHHAVATQTIAKSIFDEFKFTLRQGSKMSVGDFFFTSLPRFEKNSRKRGWVSERETCLAVLIMGWEDKQAHLPVGARVRDVMDSETLEAFIEQATIMANVKASLTYRPEQSNA